ncbi:Saccharopine dehydrogenase-domain-containing protein, partial [Dimargaris cristalligena]
IGIRREDKNLWERRVALIPDDIEKLIAETGVKVIVQPSNNRIYPDALFEKAGATVQEDLGPADVIFGIKEVPRDQLLPNKTYVIFSHTHKGQPYNQPTLQTIVDRRIRLIDYELLTDDTTGHRTVLFGRQAGQAGMLDCLHGLGRRLLLARGYHTPFLFTGMAHHYPTLANARHTLTDTVGHLLQRDGVPRALGPLTFVFSGGGHVAKGAQEILKLLPHQYIPAADLPALAAKRHVSHKRVYATQLHPEDYLERKDGQPFDKADYYKHPEKYRSTFHEKIAPYTSVLVNGLFWTGRGPRLLTKEQLAEIQVNPQLNHRMLAIADIGCDIGGPLEFMSHFSSIDQPFYYYDAVKDREHLHESEPGVQILGVENLPAELPLESSRFFSHSLMPLMADIIHGRWDSSSVLKRATIAHDGHLATPHAHLRKGWSKVAAAKPESPSTKTEPKGTSVKVTSREPRRVLLLGSGMVAKPLVDYLTRQPDIHVTVASNAPADAAALVQGKSNATSVPLDIGNGQGDLSLTLDPLLKQSDVLVSFVPAPLHPALAQRCIALGKSMVTASYISPAMHQLDSAARQAGVIIMNEIGLDPGIDHLTAMKIIDEAHRRGGRVRSFISWCGGLPAPEASGGSNPFGYKFSWSPRGVLTAGRNPAQFKMNGRVHTIDGPQLLATGFPDVPLYTGFALEGLANRDSLQYVDTYGLGPVESMDTMFRGTLRYQGYSDLMDGLARLGLLSTDPLSTSGPAIAQLLGAANNNNHNSPQKDARVQRVRSALEWLGLLRSPNSGANGGGGIDLPPYTTTPPTALDGLCEVLQAKMKYGPGERDMSMLFHEFVIDVEGQTERHTSGLVVYGSPPDEEGGVTSMAKTVGLPAAMATELILRGQLPPDGRLNGVRAPIYPEVYLPILAKLAEEGIHVTE